MLCSAVMTTPTSMIIIVAIITAWRTFDSEGYDYSRRVCCIYFWMVAILQHRNLVGIAVFHCHDFSLPFWKDSFINSK